MKSSKSSKMRYFCCIENGSRCKNRKAVLIKEGDLEIHACCKHYNNHGPFMLVDKVTFLAKFYKCFLC